MSQNDGVQSAGGNAGPVARSLRRALRITGLHRPVQAARRKIRDFRRGPDRYSSRTPEQAATALLAACRQWRAVRPGPVLVIGPPSPYRQLILDKLVAGGLPVRCVDATGEAAAAGEVSCIVLAIGTSAGQFGAARALTDAPATEHVPVEYVALPLIENGRMVLFDRLQAADFISPLLLRHDQALYDIYEQSLERFRQKTEVRDYLDLCQCLDRVRRLDLPGNVAEFGSYHGHSGWLTSRVLEHLGSTSTLFMFDMFESFPSEDTGIDGFWSGTHTVDFATVSKNFSDRSNVQLVKGDFTMTLPDTPTGPLSLVFIDCDSYRGTKYLLEALWTDRVVAGGVVIMEDYGHAALLGNRLATHEFFDERKDALTFFSQFSGLFISWKLP